MNLIEQLGGVVAVAEAIGVTHGAIGNWRRRGWPDSARFKLLALAEAKGFRLSPADLDQVLRSADATAAATATSQDHD